MCMDVSCVASVCKCVCVCVFVCVCVCVVLLPGNETRPAPGHVNGRGVLPSQGHSAHSAQRLFSIEWGVLANSLQPWKRKRNFWHVLMVQSFVCVSRLRAVC